MARADDSSLLACCTSPRKHPTGDRLLGVQQMRSRLAQHQQDGRQKPWARARLAVQLKLRKVRSAEQRAERADALAAEAADGVYVVRRNRSVSSADSAESPRTSKSRLQAAMLTARRLAADAAHAWQEAKAATQRLVDDVALAALRTNPGLAVDLLGGRVRALAPAIRQAAAEAVVRIWEGGVVDLGPYYDLVVHRPHHPVGASMGGMLAEEESLAASAQVLPVLLLRLCQAGKAPAYDENALGDKMHAELTRPSAASPPSACASATGGLCSELYRLAAQRAGGADGARQRRRHGRRWSKAMSDEGWPAGWAEKDVLATELDLDLAARSNWRHDPVSFELRGKAWWAPSLRLCVMAFVLRVRVAVWWNTASGELRLAILDDSRFHFRSHSELAFGCLPSLPDTYGLTSLLVRALLRFITPQQPLEVDLGPPQSSQAGKGEGEAEEGPPREVRWTNGLTGVTYRLPLGGGAPKEESEEP